MKLIIVALMSLLSSIVVHAETYTTDTNLFENTYTNNLIDMAETQIDNFNNKDYIIIEITDNYYLIASNDISVNENQIIMNNTEIIQAIKAQDGYSYNYTYGKKEETQTIVNVNNIVVSNIDTTNSVSSKRYEDYKYNKDVKNLGIFILGIVFAIFITKERNY